MSDSGKAEWTSSATNIISEARSLAVANKCGFISPYHIAFGVFYDVNSLGARIVSMLGLEITKLIEILTRSIKNLPSQTPAPSEPSFSQEAMKIINTCEQKRIELGDTFVAADHFILALYEVKEISTLLEQFGLPLKTAKSKLMELRKGKKVTNKFQDENYDALSKYAIDLCSMAEEGKLEPVIGRGEEIKRTIRVLSRRTKNNPVLIGEPGVGKTAIVEGIAQRIVNGDVPDNLKGRIFSLDMGSVVAGAKYQGEFEERMKAILDDVKKNQDKIILFIDEIHLVLGAGKNQGAMDAANLLKPMLARGELRTIGATTLDEYRKYVENDAAFERRFMPITVLEPSIEETISILRGLKERYESHHGVQITDSALVMAAKLSDRYISSRFLPDKAIDLIDEACANIHVQLSSRPEKIDELERKKRQLEIEAKALENDVKKDVNTIERLKVVKGDIQKVNDQLIPLKDKYEEERKRNVILQDLQKRFEEKKKKYERAERDGEFALAADLKYNVLPQIQAEINSYKEKIEDAKKSNMLQDTVTEVEVQNVVSRWTGIPLDYLSQTEKDVLLNLQSALRKRIKGQDEAINLVCDAILRSRAGLAKPNRPTGSFLFLGGSGVGKTELAKTITATLYGSEKSMIRLDMSEYSEQHSIAKLIGAPPGYVGYESGGHLTEPVRRKPHSLVLFDEIEKAHHSIFNMLLQILDDGRLTDSHGRTVDFSNTIIILTSNLGAEYLKLLGKEPNNISGSDGSDGGNFTYEMIKEKVMETVRGFFRPELLNRFEDIILFQPLQLKELKEIIDLIISDVNVLLAEKNIFLKLSENAKMVVLEEGFDRYLGARPLRRWIEKNIVTELSKLIISGKLVDGIVSVDVDKSKKLCFNIKK